MLFSSQLAEETPGLIVQPYWVLVTIVQFAILYFLLRKFLWTPVTRMLTDRSAKIREGLDLVASAQRDREEMKREVESLLTEARREAAALAERSTQATEAAGALLRAEAKAEADRIRERGRADAAALHDQALAQLRSEVAGLVIAAASRILGAEIDPARHRALIERSLAEAGDELDRPN